MRAYVFTDAALAKQAGRFVWLSIDTEKPINAAFLEKYTIEAWPSFFVVAPDTERVALKWLGSATVPQLVKLLDDGEMAVRGGGATGSDAALVKADALNGQGRAAEAAVAYRAALDAAPADWPHRARAIESEVMADQAAHADEACAKRAMELVPTLPDGPSYLNAASTGLACALGADGAAWKDGAVTKLEPLVRRALGFEEILADDRSGAYDALIETAEARKDAAGAKRIAGDWIAFLESEAAKASSPEARAVFDPHRVAAAIALGDPGRTVPALLQTEKDLPADYNAPARLAVLYREMGRFDDAIAAVDRALTKAYGPRKIRVFETKAGIYQKKGDVHAAKQTYEDALQFAASLPASQHGAEITKRLKAAVAKLPPG